MWGTHKGLSYQLPITATRRHILDPAASTPPATTTLNIPPAAPNSSVPAVSRYQATVVIKIIDLLGRNRCHISINILKYKYK